MHDGFGVGIVHSDRGVSILCMFTCTIEEVGVIQDSVLFVGDNIGICELESMY
jgi:hypothetical protein